MCQYPILTIVSQSYARCYGFPAMRFFCGRRLRRIRRQSQRKRYHQKMQNAAILSMLSLYAVGQRRFCVLTRINCHHDRCRWQPATRISHRPGHGARNRESGLECAPCGHETGCSFDKAAGRGRCRGPQKAEECSCRKEEQGLVVGRRNAGKGSRNPTVGGDHECNAYCWPVLLGSPYGGVSVRVRTSDRATETAPEGWRERMGVAGRD